MPRWPKKKVEFWRTVRVENFKRYRCTGCNNEFQAEKKPTRCPFGCEDTPPPKQIKMLN